MRKLVLSTLALLTGLVSAGAIEIIHGPYLQNVGATEATIVWISDSVSVGWVEIMPNDGSEFYNCTREKIFDARSGIRNESTVHAVKITGLEPGSSYNYRVYSKEVTSHKGNVVLYGEVVATHIYQVEPLHFTTLDPDAESVSFCMMNDVHEDERKLEKYLGLIDLEATDMILFVGDMVSVFENQEQVFKGFMDKAVELFAAQKPMYYTRGNHETRGKGAYDFQKYFSPFSEHIYYMYRQGPVCFVALDCGEDKPDTDIEYYDLTQYDQYRSEEAKWLAEVLKSKEYVSAPFKVITCHMPPAGRGMHGESDIASKFIPLLEQSGADIMLSGHLHENVHNDAGTIATFPVIVNSSQTLLKANATANKLEITVVDFNGKTVDCITINK